MAMIRTQKISNVRASLTSEKKAVMALNKDGCVLVTGGVGFIGTHLCRALLQRGLRVIALDDMSAAQLPVASDLLEDPGFTLMEHDVTVPFSVPEPLTAIVHLAGQIGPANPIEGLRASSIGTFHCLDLARSHAARIVLASSGDIYGDPTESPQREEYRGNVDPVGPRSAYEEARRFLEAATTAYRREFGVNTGIVRPFNIYGPDVQTNRRAVPSFISKALAGQELILHGGDQSRSLCFVGDFVAGLIAMLECDEPGPVNLGSNEVVTIRQLAELVVSIVGSGSITVVPAVVGDTSGRCPDIRKAAEVLGWRPVTSVREGITASIEAMRRIEVAAK
jgi:dTDP-glucose 4,6-dehydratase